MNSLLLQKRLKKTRLAGYLLDSTPFVSAALLNGSLAQGKAKLSSDIDFLIISKSGRLYTTRFLINLVFVLIGQKRSKDESKSHSGKFCFNYFMTEEHLKIPDNRSEVINLYCAENYSQSILVCGRKDIFEKFMRANKDLFEGYGRNRNMKLASAFPVRAGYFSKIVRSIGEYCLSGQIGSWVEVNLKNYQIKRIQADERTKSYPDLIVYNDYEARFHPPKGK